MAKVTLLAYTPQPEKLAAAAAKLCYSSVGIDGVMDGLTSEKTASFVEMLSEIGHESPMEHASFTFGIEGVSRALLAQITRHRIASFSVQSQRYVAEQEFGFVLPPEIAEIPEAKAEFLAAMEESQRRYNRLVQLLKEKHRQAFLSVGKDEKNRRPPRRKVCHRRRPFRIAQRLRNQNDRYLQYPFPAPFFCPAVL